MYEVEKIVNYRLNRHSKKPEYYVKWENYDSDQNTWQPIDNLSTCKSLISEFHKKKDKGKTSILTSLKKTKAQDDSENEKIEDAKMLLKSLSKKKKDFDNRYQSEESSSPVKLKPKNTQKTSHQNKARREGNENKRHKKEIKILAMGFRQQSDQKYFKILIDGEKKWVQRCFLIPQYAVQYCEYLQSNICLKD